MRFVTTLLVVACVFALGAQSASAQPEPFAEMSRRLAVRQTVAVVTADGQQLRGKVIDVTTQSFTLNIADEEARRFDVGSVREVALIDSIWNGAAVGAAAGAVPGFYLAQISCGESTLGCHRAAIKGLYVFGAIGAVVGAALDDLSQERIYRSHDGAVAITIAPLLTPHSRGLFASLRF